MWVVYDEKGYYLARRFIVGERVILSTPETVGAPTLDELRALLAPGRQRGERHPHDKPEVVEVWA